MLWVVALEADTRVRDPGGLAAGRAVSLRAGRNIDITNIYTRHDAKQS